LGDDRMKGLIESVRAQPLEANVVHLLDAVQTWCLPKGPLDDVSILGIEWHG